MVGAGQPQGGVALHPAPADEDVLQSLIQCVTHMQLAGDVRRGNHDGIGFLFGVGLSVEIVALHPEVIGSVFHFLRLIGFRQFLAHGVPSFQ